MHHPVELSPDRARRLLLHATGLDGAPRARGLEGMAGVLDQLGCVQIDPIDRIGTNTDLVFHARVEGTGRGQWARLMPGRAFEHFAKERCLLPARAFPYYRHQAVETPWWRLTDRLKRLDTRVLDAVLAEVAARGPLTKRALADQGQVAPLEWNGWVGTTKAASMAIDVLWTRCQVVVSGRVSGGQCLYDLPERALGQQLQHTPAPGAYTRWAVLQRVRSAGLLALAGGPTWSMLSEARKGPLVDALVAEGALVLARVTGSSRPYLCLPELLEATEVGDDTGPMRVLGPLDPLLWDRKLVAHLFDFEYLWEVYKPAHKRRWGYYVCPLLHQGRLVGRIEANRKADTVEVDQVWGEPDRHALAQALARLTALQARA